MTDTAIMSDFGTDYLFNELCQRFPEVPGELVTTLMKEHLCNRQRCIEALARMSDKYLYGQGDIVPKMGRVNIGGNPPKAGAYNPGAGYETDFRLRSNSAGSLQGVGSSGMNPHGGSNQTKHISAVYQRVDGSYSSAGQTHGYDSPQPIPRRHVQIHISGGGPPHGHNSSSPLITQTSRSGAPVSQIARPNALFEEQWNGDIAYHQSGAPQYPYHPPPVVQRQVQYGPDGNWTATIQNGPTRPHGFTQMFPVNNGNENIGGSPETTPNSATVSSVSYTGTPSTPPSGANNTLRYPQSPEDSKGGVVTSKIDFTAVSGNHGQYLRQPSGQVTNQNTTFQSHMFIPSPQTQGAVRTPSPIHPQPPPSSSTGGNFYAAATGQPIGPSARPPQSLPPFPHSSNMSSDSSPGTPRHQQYPQSVPQIFAHPSPNRSQQNRHRVVFQIPGQSNDNPLRKGYQEGDYSYALPRSEQGSSVDNQGFAVGQLYESRPSRSGSIEESQYMQTLLEYQKQRKLKLNSDLQDNYRFLQRLQSEVGQIERNILERKKIRTCTVTAEDIQKIRQENTRLKVNIELLTHEIDVVNNGQTPLGILDTHQLQSFYKNIAPGQRVSSQNNSRPSTPPRRAPPRPPPPQPHISPPSVHQHPFPPPPQPLNRPAPIAPPEEPVERANWTCSACTFLNHPDLDKCEMCEMPCLVGAGKDWELV